MAPVPERARPITAGLARNGCAAPFAGAGVPVRWFAVVAPTRGAADEGAGSAQ